MRPPHRRGTPGRPGQSLRSQDSGGRTERQHAARSPHVPASVDEPPSRPRDPRRAVGRRRLRPSPHRPRPRRAGPDARRRSVWRRSTSCSTPPCPLRSGWTAPLALPEGRTEVDVLAELRALAGRNRVLTSLIGMGYYGTVTPPVILRNLLENPAWYTAYTPYQPEISQGRLEALLNFQTMVSDLTGMDLANASHARRGHRGGRGDGHGPPALEERQRRVPRRRRHPSRRPSRCCARGPSRWASRWWSATSPSSTRSRPSACWSPTRARPGGCGTGARSSTGCTTGGGLVVVATDLLALVLLEAPGAWGADIVVGSAQRFGVPLGFGGPHAAFLATRDAYARGLPGRLVGVSTDTEGRPALRLALQTREQHIRREQATSNICTAQVLLANIAGMYAVWHGPEGLRRIAERVHRLTGILAARPARRRRRGGARRASSTPSPCGCPGAPPRWLPRPATAASTCASVDDDTLGVSLDETTTPAVVAGVWEALRRRAPRSRSSTPRSRRRCPPACAAPPRSSPTRCSTATTASTSCSATCAAWPTRTWPSTGP